MALAARSRQGPHEAPGRARAGGTGEVYSARVAREPLANAVLIIRTSPRSTTRFNRRSWGSLTRHIERSLPREEKEARYEPADGRPADRARYSP